jgi:hypothetical protein
MPTSDDFRRLESDPFALETPNDSLNHRGTPVEIEGIDALEVTDMLTVEQAIEVPKP